MEFLKSIIESGFAPYILFIIGAVVLVIAVLYNRVVITKDKIDLSKSNEKLVTSMTDVYKSIETKLELVIDKAIQTGLQTALMRFVDLYDLQINYAKEQFVILKNVFIKAFDYLVEQSKAESPKEESILFTSALTIYFYVLLNDLEIIFDKINKETEIKHTTPDDLDTKTNLFIAEWKRILTIHFPYQFSSLKPEKILALIDDTDVNYQLIDAIKHTLNYAINCKNEMDMKIVQLSQETKNYTSKVFLEKAESKSNQNAS